MVVGSRVWSVKSTVQGEGVRERQDGSSMAVWLSTGFRVRVQGSGCGDQVSKIGLQGILCSSGDRNPIGPLVCRVQGLSTVD